MNPKWYVFSILLFLCLVSTGSATTEDLTPISAFPSFIDSADEFAAESVTILQAFGFERQVTTDSLYRENPRTDGTYITWVEWDATSKIWYYDIASGKQSLISNSKNNQNYPDIQAGIAVWQESGAKKNIMSTSLSPLVSPRTVYTSDTTATRPAVYGDRVVWEDYAGKDYTNIFYQRIGDTFAGPLSKSQKPQSNPRIYGDYVVWQELDSGIDDWNIYLFNLNTEEKKQLTRDRSAQINPDISGNLVVWEDHRDGLSNIMVHDIERDVTTAVTFDGSSNILPAVSKNIIVWSRMGKNGYDIYMVNLAGPTTYLVAQAPGDQLYADIDTDIIVWQDTRLGGSNIFFYQLEAETKFVPYLFYGSATINFQPIPVGAVIEAKIDGVTRGTIDVTEVGRYGSMNQMVGRQLTVPISQQDLGKSISFWYGGVEGLPRVQVSGDGGMVEWPLEFPHAEYFGSIILHGTVRVNGMAAPAGTVISASIDGVPRNQYTITEAGLYGSSSPVSPQFSIPITEMDLGKTITFSIGGFRAEQTFFVQTGGTFNLDLTGTDQPVPTPTWTPQPTPGLVAYMDATPRSGPAPLTVQFVDLSIGNPTLWVWDFGDGSPSSLEPYPVHTFTNPGTYTVTLEIANTESFDAITMSHYITVSGHPVPTPTLTPHPTPGPGPIPLDDSSSDDS